MAVMNIAVDGATVAAVDLARLDMFAVHLYGDLTSADAACLSCHGGTYPDDGPSTFRIWAEQALPGRTPMVTVTFTDSAPAAQLTQGKTIAEMFPDEPHSGRTDFTPTPAEEAELRNRPRVRAGFSWALRTSGGDDLAGRNGSDDDSFAFSVLWTPDYPTQARVNGSTTNIDNVLRRAGGTELYNGMLHVGDSVTFRCGD
ncbi:hypothetical protein ACFFTM_22380 [Pseudoduganella plicata]|uniref:Uncharacterized protein n=1 Tax=Pseudoduganella plicata TaxID=321984 RepID=A0A4P7BE48_9BURK|nr:hypothetical protein [Pseudoduganella plicata]QBQ36237.1 hypothetical protein E1742_08795 [Pseudoduganella plicata]GGY76679.1 hypothetical protein GCM10007388_06790 [Pseudoduganella plicata]